MKNEFPGIKKTAFYIKVKEMWFNKGDRLDTGKGQTVKVIKVYRNTWWRRLLLKLGFKVRIFELKVI